MSNLPRFEQYPFQIGSLPDGAGEGYVIAFPDLPGCTADGATEAEAIANARGAFHAWMASIIEDKKAIPPPYSAGSKHDPAESEAFTLEQHERIRANIRARGMTFEVFLPESLADWLRAKIAAGAYADAKEAAYLAFQDLRELDQHPQVRRELLTAMINESLNEPGRTYSPAEVRAQLRAMVREYVNTEPPSAGSTPLPAPRKFSYEQIQGWIADDEKGRRRHQLDWSQCSAVESIAGKMSGAWVLKGTRMPVSAILDNIEAGATVDDVMQWYEGLDRELVNAVIAFAGHTAAALNPSKNS
jgi:predicted RNase H-like HicB family nuclease/uncharacterized protein (DUF433 family)/Arc/MetJ-type ribon-helix-helix transcriptional regulator